MLELEPQERAYAIIDQKSTLMASITVARAGNRWQAHKLGQKNLTRAIYRLRRHAWSSTPGPDTFPTGVSETKHYQPPPAPSPDFALFIPELYELFLGTRQHWPRAQTILIPVYDSPYLGYRRGEPLAAESVFAALDRLIGQR